MTWISLHQAKFRAPIGVFEEEKQNHNDILIDVSVKVNTRKANKSDELEETVDYQSLYNIVKEVVQEGSNLMEAIGQKIGDSIFQTHPTVKKVKVKVSKLNPPISGDCASSSVSMTFKQ